MNIAEWFKKAFLPNRCPLCGGFMEEAAGVLRYETTDQGPQEMPFCLECKTVMEAAATGTDTNEEEEDERDDHLPEIIKKERRKLR